MMFDLVTNIDGRVVHVLNKWTSGGLQSVWMSPLDLILIPATIAGAAGALASRVVYTVLTLARRRAAAAALSQGATRELTAAAATSGPLHSVHVGTFGEPGHLIARIEVEQRRVVYQVSSIHLKAEGSAAEVAARAAHRDMLERAAKAAQARGEAQFTYRGMDANKDFQAHADKLAREVGVTGSAKTFPGSAPGYVRYEVTLDSGKVMASNQARAAASTTAPRTTQRGVGIGARTPATAARAAKPEGKISVAEMEKYLLDVLAKRQDLRASCCKPSPAGELVCPRARRASHLLPPRRNSRRKRHHRWMMERMA